MKTACISDAWLAAPACGGGSGPPEPPLCTWARRWETRTLLTTYFVDTTVDESDGDFGPGDLSLREAMELSEANPGADVIRFAAGLEGATFNITQGPLPTVTQSLQIIGTIGNAQLINGAGLHAIASGAGTNITFATNSVNINLEPTGAGLLVEAVDDGVATISILNATINNSATQGVKFVAHTGGVINMTLGNVGIFSNGDVGPQRRDPRQRSASIRPEQSR